MRKIYVNDTLPTEITFNTKDVLTIYYEDDTLDNPVLVWGKWPGWEDASLKDIYNLCKMKQAGIITDWPEDIQLGAEKYIAFRWGAKEGTDTNNVGTPGETFFNLWFEIIGIDIDGPGVLTFMTKRNLPAEPIIVGTEELGQIYADFYLEGFNSYPLTSQTKKIDTLLEYLSDYSYEKVPNPEYPGEGIYIWIYHFHYLKDYIKPLNKQVYNADTGEVETKLLKMWDISCAEAGMECEFPPCFTEGVSTPYFTYPPQRHFMYSKNWYSQYEIRYGTREYTNADPNHKPKYVHAIGTNERFIPQSDLTYGNDLELTFNCACFAIG